MIAYGGASLGVPSGVALPWGGDYVGEVMREVTRALALKPDRIPQLLGEMG